MSPHLIFSRSAQARKIADFKAFMEYNSLDKINILKAGTQKEKIESFAILPPCLTKELFENINPEANHLLLKLLQKIRELREPEKKDETRP